MRDLYQRIGVPESADDGTIRAALATAADLSVREAAAFILLDPRRREVYDRNRRVLQTVGRLRANLGLNLTRFWPRTRFGDFTIALGGPASPAGGRSTTDPMQMAWAFGVQPPRAAPARNRALWIAVAAGSCLIAASAAAWWWFSHVRPA